jgi:hypothetical protein
MNRDVRMLMISPADQPVWLARLSALRRM